MNANTYRIYILVFPNLTLISVPSALPCKHFQNGSEFESHCSSLPCISSHSGKTFALGRETERRADSST